MRSSVLAWLVAAVCLAVGLTMAWHQPVSPLLCLVLVCLSGCLVAWQPRLWLWMVPASLPWLNFSPWTGWLMFEEFDILLLSVLAGGYARLAWESKACKSAAYPGAANLLVGLVVVSGLLALERGFVDAGGLRFDWFANYSDALNSWRVFKGLGLAALFIPLLRRELIRSPLLAQNVLAAGIVSGLTLVVLATLWERAAFPGLLDFSNPYRTVALFWEMHVGGAAIDAYLAITTPFVVWALYATRRPSLWLALAILAILVGYACLTTFARGVYLAVSAPLALLAFLLWLQNHAHNGRNLWQGLQHQSHSPGWRMKASLVLSVALVLEVVLVLKGGTFMSERLASAEQDLSSRVAHWKHGVGLLKTPADWLLGKGLGRLPANYAAQVPNEEFPGDARYHLEHRAGQADQPFVTLYGPKTQAKLGGVFELTQRVVLAEPGGYRIRMNVRVTKDTRLEFYLCERHLLYDRACQAAFLRIRPTKDAGQPAWQVQTVALEGPPLGHERRFAPRLKMFSMSVIDAGGKVDLDDVKLVGHSSSNLLVNGDFSAGLSHWFPAAQGYFVPWHLDNLFLENLVERGLFGLLAWLMLVGYALWHLVLGRARLAPLAPYVAASLMAVLLVGLVSSVMDVPRVAFLFWLLLFLAVQLSKPGQNTPDQGHRSDIEL
jgi:hypothetical protein